MTAADTTTGAALFADALERYGVSRVFGNPGTTELPIVEAVAERDLEYVLALHEDVAVGAAAGYASTRRYHAEDAAGIGAGDDRVNPVGVVNLHLAPGTAHGLGNLYGAMAAGAPLVVTSGNHSTDFRHEEPALAGDPAELAEQFSKWSAEVLDVAALPTMLRRAFRVALTPPTGPVFLALPLDVLKAKTDREPERLGAIPTAGRGDAAQIERAADRLSESGDLAMIVGDGVARSGRDAIEAAVDLAEATGCRVHAEIHSGEVNFPEDHDQWAGHVPPDADLAARAMDADALLFAGISTNTTLVAHGEALVDPSTTCVHVGDDPWQLGKNHPADAAVLGDPGDVLADLAGRVRDRIDEGARRDRLESIDDRRVSIEDASPSVGREADPGETRSSKTGLVEALYDAAPEAFVVDEGVTSNFALLSRWPFEPRGLLSNKGGGLGYGLPAAVGAAVAEDERESPRPVLGFVGDGSYLYYPNALYTAVRRDLDLTVVIPDNQNYRILKDNALEVLGDDPDLVGMDFDPPVDLVADAESYGASAERIETEDGIEPAVDRALERDGPTLLDVLVHD